MNQSLRQLTRKILLAIEGELPRAELIQLAEDYARVCRDINERLDQLATLITRENYYSALQLAESEPAVMDIVAQLSFAQSEQWRELCVEQKLSVPERLNESAIRQVQGLYSNEHVDTAYLYREYRSAILQKNYPSAMRCLRTILRINPSDSNARDEQQRLQENQQGVVWKELGQALKEKDDERVLALLDEIESSSYSVSEDNPLWQEAKSLRRQVEQQRSIQSCQELERSIQELADAGAWETLLQRKRNWDQLVQSGGVEVEESTRQHLDALAAQAELELGSEEERGVQEEIARQWFFFLKETESALRGTVAASDCREALRKLGDFRRQLLVAGAAPDDTLDADTRKVEEQLIGKLRQARHKKGVFAGIGVLVCLVVLVVGLSLYERKVHREESLHLMAEALEEKDLNQVERLLQLWEQQSSGFTANPGIAAMHKEARQWFEREKQNESQVDRIYRRVRSWLPLGKAQLEPIQVDLAEAEELWNSLLPASRENLRFIRQEVLLSWDRLRTEWVQEDHTELERLAGEFRTLWEKNFSNVQSPEDHSREIIKANELLREAQPVLARLILLQEIPAENTQFWEKAEQDLVTMDEQFALYQQGVDLLGENRSLESFRYGITLLAELPFEASNWVTASRTVSQTVEQWSEPSKALLQAGADQGFAQSAVSGGAARFFPERLNSSENLQLRALFDQSLALKLFRYDVHNYRNGTLLRDTEVIYAMGELEAEANPHGDREEVVQVVRLVTPNTLKKNPYYEEMVFMATRRLHDKQWRDGSALINGARISEADFLEQLKNAIDYQPESGRIGRSLLYALDELFRQPEVDAVFRAWVFGELIQVVLNRPEEWGVLVTPALLRDWERLQRLCDGIPSLSDWIDPNRSTQIRPVIQAFFQNPSVPSYTRQATFQVQLANILGSSHWSYYGYVNNAGKIVPVAGSPESGRFLWGLEAFRNRWAPLFENQAGSWINQTSPQPLTPLFVFSEDLGQLVIQAGERTGIQNDSELQSLREYLPAYFR